jgi:hypothetical protein
MAAEANTAEVRVVRGITAAAITGGDRTAIVAAVITIHMATRLQ